MPFNVDVNKLLEGGHRFAHSTEFRRIDGIFFDETGTPFCSACISPVDNKPIGLNLQYKNKSHPDYGGGLFVYKCPGCGSDYHIAGNTLAMAKAKSPKPK
jgi:hypothetical protein